MLNWISNLNSYQAILLGFALAFLLTYVILIKKNNDFIEEQRLMNDQYYKKMIEQKGQHDKETLSE